MTTTAKEEKQNLGKIALSTPIYANVLPAQYEAIIVNLESLQTSCILPPRTFEITYRTRPNGYIRNIGRRRIREPLIPEFSTLRIEIPTLLFGHHSCEIPDRFAPPYTWYVFALDSSEDNRILTTPYAFANVGVNGDICFGRVAVPKNFRQAYNSFFASSFNSDLVDYRKRHLAGKRVHNCKSTLHAYGGHTGCLCKKDIKHDCCVCPTTTFHRHYSCGCTTVLKSKKCKGQCGNFNDTCTCCVAIQKGDESCGCTMRHKRNCKTIKGGCDCRCQCQCCEKTCGHDSENCRCSCCTQVCHCYCDCTDTDLLKSYLENYSKVVLPLQQWQDKTHAICGPKHWSTTQKAEALLVTSNSALLSRIPRQFWKKCKLNDKPFVICVGSRVSENQWHFHSSKFEFLLDGDKLNLSY